LICLQIYVLVLTLRLAVNTLIGKNKIKFGQKFFASPKICTTVHLWSRLRRVETTRHSFAKVQNPRRTT